MPNATELQESFPRIARGLLEEVPSITNLQYSPFGFIKVSTGQTEGGGVGGTGRHPIWQGDAEESEKRLQQEWRAQEGG